MDVETLRVELLKAISTDPEFLEAVRGLLTEAPPPLPPLAPPANMPSDVSQGNDGICFRTITRTDADGVVTTTQVRVCEDCWTEIPRYVDFPRGLVSPESGGDAGGNGIKRKWTTVGEKQGWESLQKVVCLACYLAAFQRTYPDAALPDLRPDFTEIIEPYTPAPEIAEYVAEPKGL